MKWGVAGDKKWARHEETNGLPPAHLEPKSYGRKSNTLLDFGIINEEGKGPLNA